MIAYRSISLRLTIWFSAVFFAGLALFGAVMWLDLKDTLTSGRSRTLERRTNRLGDLLRETQADPPDLSARKFQAFADATGSGLIEVFDANGTRALPSPTAAAQSFPWPRVTPMQIDRFSEVKFQGQPYRILAHPFSLDSQTLVLCAAAPLEGNRLVLGAFSEALLWAIPALLAISALGGYALSRRALKPVDQIVAATRSISVTNLSARLPVPETRDELQRLSETQNAMLARLESAVKEIKRFTDDASHELRSPVSFVRTTAELALRNRQIDAASRRAFEEIVAECGKASRLLKDMLTLARADAGNPRLAFEAIDLAEVVKAVCQKAVRSRMRAGTSSRTVSRTTPKTNARPWCGATTPAFSSYFGSFWTMPRSIRRRRNDQGHADCCERERNSDGGGQRNRHPGGGPATHLWRFYRADPSRSQVEGFGLGLSIATWMAGVHGAALSVDSRENEGSVFKIVFPLLAVDQLQSKDSPAAASLASVG